MIDPMAEFRAELRAILTAQATMQATLLRVEAEVRDGMRRLYALEKENGEHAEEHKDLVRREVEDKVTRAERFTKIEDAVGIRSWMGGLGIVASGVLGALGFKQG